MAAVWKGESEAELLKDYTDRRLKGSKRGDKYFKKYCVDCGAEQIFRVRDNQLTLVWSKHIA
jgi:hypothetical protein